MQGHTKVFEVKVMARVLEVSESGYYAWRKQRQAMQNDADYDLKQEILRLREHSRNSYGYRQVYLKLRDAGHQINRKRGITYHARARLGGESEAADGANDE